MTTKNTNHKYLCGITIGPIYETIKKANSPISLWYSSILFSYICFELLEALNEMPFEMSIISPVPAQEVEQNTEEEPSTNDGDSLLTKNFKQGIGVFPDRIIFTIVGESHNIKCGLDAVILKVKNRISEIIYGDLKSSSKFSSIDASALKGFFRNYFQIHYFFEEIGPVKNISGDKIIAIQNRLSFIENSICFNIQSNIDYLKEIYHGPNKNENAYVKQSYFYRNYTRGNTFKIKGISENLEKIDNYAAIASKAEENLKIGDYIAMVTADGDNFGAAIGKMSADKLSEFSANLSNYCGDAAEILKAYGCPVYYVGGDDLMFLAPLKNNDKTLFGLCEELNDFFKNSFKEYQVSDNHPVSLSFGISIQYKKFPLYEALEIANNMLAQAKSSDIITGKAKTALHLFKHSGKGIGIVFKNDMLEKIDKIVKLALNEREYLVRAIIYKLPQFSPLFESANGNNKCTDVLFDNLFDDFGADLSEKFDRAIKAFYKKIDSGKISARCSKASESAFFYPADNPLFDKLLSLIVVLKIAKFYIESGDENE